MKKKRFRSFEIKRRGFIEIIDITFILNKSCSRNLESKFFFFLKVSKAQKCNNMFYT